MYKLGEKLAIKNTPTNRLKQIRPYASLCFSHLKEKPRQKYIKITISIVAIIKSNIISSVSITNFPPSKYLTLDNIPSFVGDSLVFALH